MTSQYLDDLTPEQREAATSSFEEPLFIYAGAGSGKTRTLICRIASMIDSGIQPDNILAITFTRKSADEIRERLRIFIGPRAGDVITSTFHQLCLTILKCNPYILGFNKTDFKVCDCNTQRKIVRQVILNFALKLVFSLNCSVFGFCLCLAFFLNFLFSETIYYPPYTILNNI